MNANAGTLNNVTVNENCTIKGIPARKVSRATREVHRDRRATRGIQELQARRGHRDRKGIQEPQARRGHRDRKEIQEPQVRQGHRDQKGIQEPQVRQDRRDRKGIREPQARQGHRDRKGIQEPQVRQGHRDRKGIQDPQVRQVLRDRKGIREPQVRQDHGDHPEVLTAGCLVSVLLSLRRIMRRVIRGIWHRAQLLPAHHCLHVAFRMVLPWLLPLVWGRPVYRARGVHVVR
ncbi:fibronectin type III family protein [Escherichia coli 2-460-02_S3_C1]|nr:fibronectin type III family protein [Escherichia coli 2-460-02_S3_C1]KDY59762.1 fibronectin type III family protein [Escherichia coli 2-460-02_S3_C2]